MKNTGKVVLYVMFITILTKIMSMLSTQINVSYFGGSNDAYNIFAYANNVPTVIFTSVGTAINAVLVPTYLSLLAKKETKKAKNFLDDMISISSLLILVLVVLGFLLAPFFVKMSSYKNDTNLFNYAVYSIRVLLPVMFFFGLSFIFQGILQSNNKFKMVAAVSLPTSIVNILYIIFFAKKFGVTGLLWSNLFALSVQAIFLMPSVLKTGYRYKPSFNFKSEEIIASGKTTLTILIGTSAYQINMLFNTSLSTAFKTTAIVLLIQQFIIVPALTFIYSITSVYYPRLSALWSENNIEEYKKCLNDIISVIIFFLVPATIGIILLRYPIINLTSRWKNFTEQDAIIASNILGFYAIALLFIGLKEILDKAFYAQKSTMPSAIVGIIMMVTNITISLSLKNTMGTNSLPLAYSISGIVGVVCLFVILIKKIGAFIGETIITLIKCVISSIFMGIFVYMVYNRISTLNFGGEIITRLIIVLLPTLVGCIVYFVMTYALKVSQCKVFVDKFLQKVG